VPEPDTERPARPAAVVGEMYGPGWWHFERHRSFSSENWNAPEPASTQPAMSHGRSASQGTASTVWCTFVSATNAIAPNPVQTAA
jgi:uncharacterized membrane-anchored protein